MISINGKTKEKKKKKKKEEEAAADDEGVIGDCVGNLLAAASTGHRSCFVVFFFFFFFFFWGTCLLLLLWFFFFFFFPYKFLCSRSEIIRSPSELYSSSCSFISSRSNHNFIPVYWPKFTGKAETKRNRSNLKNRSQFIKPEGRTAVHAGPCFFGMERFFTLNKPESWMVRGFSVRTVRFGPGFKTLVHTSLGCQFLDFLKYWLRGNFELYASERSLLDLKDIFDWCKSWYTNVCFGTIIVYIVLCWIA